MRKLIACSAVLLCFGFARPGLSQMPLEPGRAPASASPLTQPTLSPGALELLTLEDRFAKSVAKGGGAAFASWFADDAITLNNGKAPVYGRRHIAENATWKPEDYQLTWTPEYAQMSAQGDMGYTWGHYEGTSKDRNGNPVKTDGRYMTIWKKMPDGSWKVTLDASAEDAPAAGDCCKLPNP